LANEEYERRIVELLGRISQQLYTHSRHLVRWTGMTRPQLAAMLTLLRRGESTIGVLARRLSVSAPTLSGILDRLEEKGLVERRRSSHDRRMVLIRSAPGARSLLDVDLSLLSPGFSTRLARLPEDEKGRIVEALRTLADLLGEPHGATTRAEAAADVEVSLSGAQAGPLEEEQR
jgi:DNA-binding MarR family transcriptional regulator